MELCNYVIHTCNVIFDQVKMLVFGIVQTIELVVLGKILLTSIANSCYSIIVLLQRVCERYQTP